MSTVTHPPRGVSADTLHRVIHGYSLKPIYYHVRWALMKMREDAAYAQLQRAIGSRDA
jgi:hypothetical protein